MSTTNQSSTEVSKEVEIIEPVVEDNEALWTSNLLSQNLTSAELKAKLLEMGDEIQHWRQLEDEESIIGVEWWIPIYKEVLRVTLEKETHEAARKAEVAAAQLALYYSSHTSQPWEAPRYGDGTIDCSSVQCYCDGSCGSYDSY